ncbi:MAG: SAM-dependent methyltransferase, partial [Verrucomicrobia bacterium]|nr:SAM-dependent methyltransferase [Verrucomicrobiota bacterium]
FRLNSLSLENNVVLREDCLKFLEKESILKNCYDVIVIDPPTISRSKKMDQFFDIQVDYIFLISSALKLLKTGGVIFFSTNSRKFRFDLTKFPECLIVDVSKKTIPIDFHDAKIHQCWKISLK